MLSSSSCSLSSWFTSSCTYHLITVPVLTLTMSFEEPTLASVSWTDFVSAGSASVSLSPRLCTRLPIVSDLQRVSDLGARRRLRSSSTSALVAPRTVRATIGDRAFPAAAASVWNSLPETVRHLHRHHYQFSAEDWRLNFFPVLQLFCLMSTALTALTTTWPTLLLRVLAVLGLYATSSQFVVIIIIIIIYHSFTLSFET